MACSIVRAPRATDNIAVTPNARSVHTKKKAWVDLPISQPTTPLAPFMWMTGTTSPRSDPRRMIMYPARRSASASVPYSQTTKTSTAKWIREPRRRHPEEDIVGQVKRHEKIESKDVIVKTTLCFM